MNVRIYLLTLTVLAPAALLSGPDRAAAQTAAESLLEEVVVTARRREENLEDLPMSVVALSGEALRAQGVYNTLDISDFAANLSLSESDQRGRHEIFVRGIGSGGPQGSTTVAGAGMYIDGHYLASQFNTDMNTIDIERIEVLRGPQGTLFGKNVTGGAVNIITTKPREEFEAEVSLRAGDYGARELRGMVNVPLADNLYGRFTFASEQSDGWVHNRFLNRQVDWTDTQSFRGALRYAPNDNLTVDFTVSGGQRRDGQNPSSCRVRPAQTLVDALANKFPAGMEDGEPYLAADDPAVLALHPPQIWDGPVYSDDDGVGPDNFGGPDPEPLELAPGIVAVVGGPEELLYPGATIDFWKECITDTNMGDFVTSDEREEFTDADDQAAFLAVAWDAGETLGALEGAEMKINASWRESDYNYSVDLDNSPFDIKNQHTVGPTSIRDTNRSLELLFDATANDQLTFLLGAYYFWNRHGQGTGRCWDLFQNEFLSNRSANPDVRCDQGEWSTAFEKRSSTGRPARIRSSTGTDTSTALFGHLTYVLASNWTVDFGARRTQDDREFRILEVPFACAIVNPRHGCMGTPIINEESVFEEGNFNSNSGTFEEFTPMVSLNHDLADGNSMVYFLYSEGYLTGGFNDEFRADGDPFLEPLVVFGPESVNNYEVGFKGTIADGRVRIAASAFFMDYSGKQEELEIANSDPNAVEGEIDLITNASSVDVRGLEMELRSSPWEGGFLTVDASYLKNEYNEYLVPDVEADDPATAPPLDLSDLGIAHRSPEWTVNVSLGHTFVLGNGALLTPQFGVYAQDNYEFLDGISRGAPPSFCSQDSYSKLRTRITYLSPGDRWEAALYGRNITDERYLADCKTEDPSGTYVVRYEPPARWGLEFVTRF